MQLELNTHISPFLTTGVVRAAVIDSRRVVGSNPIWGWDFSEFPVVSLYLIIIMFNNDIIIIILNIIIIVM